MNDDCDEYAAEEPDLAGSALAAWEENRRCLAESLALLAELDARGVDVTRPGAVVPPEYAARLRSLEDRLEAARPEMERIARDRRAFSSAARRADRGLRL
jgi:hypothetical protein